MRIGVIASPWVAVPPPAYGGTESVIHNLCVGLDRLGHEVHLVTIGESTCPVLRSSVFDHPTGMIGDPVAEIVHARAAYALLAGADVIHDHTIVGPQLLPEAAAGPVPVVTTWHGPFSPQARMMFTTRPPGLSLVAISHAQRATAPEVDVDAVIHHGVDLDVHRPGPGGGGYLAFIGRMSPDKGPDRAIEVARRAGMPLVIVAKMREQGELAFYEQHVRPLLGPDVTFAGEADAAERRDLLRHAEALVNPIQWPEPFGLVMAESLASGTPVVALRNGAAPEIVDDGRTGFLCDDLDEMVAAVARVDDLDRAACRAAAEERFSVARMAADHAELYEHVIACARDRRLAARLARPSSDGSANGAAAAAGIPEAVGVGRSDPGAGAAARGAAPNVTPLDPARTHGRRRLGLRRRPLDDLGSSG
jgi:glycosyltransferase involved in cell wall biosynthesis